MIAEINIDHDQKVIIGSFSGDIDPKQALLLISEIAFTVEQYNSYNILVDISSGLKPPPLVEDSERFCRSGVASCYFS